MPTAFIYFVMSLGLKTIGVDDEQMQSMEEPDAAVEGLFTNFELDCPFEQYLCLGHTGSWGNIDFRNVSTTGTRLLPVLAYTRALIQVAIEVEHSTIPLYLTAMYSIVDPSSHAYVALQSVVMEEMLHMVIACNLLNAIGGSPMIDTPNFVPVYPVALPFINVTADVAPFSKRSINNFIYLERPPADEYSISDAYSYISQLLQHLVQQNGQGQIFVGDPGRQVEASIPKFKQTARPIRSLDDAVTAMSAVADQGGGCPVDMSSRHPYEQTDLSAGAFAAQGAVDKIAHYARFTEVLAQRKYAANDTAETGPTGEYIRSPWDDVYSFSPNPRVQDFPRGSTAHRLARAFAGNYTRLLGSLHKVFNGHPGMLMDTLAQMYALKALAIKMLQTSDPRAPDRGIGIGPTWQYLSPSVHGDNSSAGGDLVSVDDSHTTCDDGCVTASIVVIVALVLVISSVVVTVGLVISRHRLCAGYRVLKRIRKDSTEINR